MTPPDTPHTPFEEPRDTIARIRHVLAHTPPGNTTVFVITAGEGQKLLDVYDAAADLLQTGRTVGVGSILHGEAIANLVAAVAALDAVYPPDTPDTPDHG